QLLGDGLVADEVVVHEKYVPYSEPPELVELAPHLLRRFHPGLSSEHYYDVAELAPVRAAARKLEADGLVPVELQEIEARGRRVFERYFLRFLVELLRRTVFEVPAEFLPYVFRLARHDGI